MATVTTTATTTTVTTPAYDEIVRVVQLYYDGFGRSDVNRFEEAFHEDAWIFYTDADGVLHNGLLTDRFVSWAAGQGHSDGRADGRPVRVGDVVHRAVVERDQVSRHRQAPSVGR
jgi:hypothetical protein